MKNNNWKFYNPTKIIFGRGSFKSLGRGISTYGNFKNVLLICGRKSLRRSGYLNKAIKLLSGKKITLIDSVESNPEVSFIDGVLRCVRKKKPEVVVGIGGGSVIDVAKVVALLADKRYSLRGVLDKNIPLNGKGLACIAVPTTAGTGSEVTATSSLWQKSCGLKLTLRNENMFPNLAIIDPLLSLSLSPYQTAIGGLDTLSHAVESYGSKKTMIFTQAFSLNAVELVFANLKKAFNNPKGLIYRESMSLASLYAGLAISNTGTTMAHAVSYYLTAQFGIPHGLACALSLSRLIRHNVKKSQSYFKPLAGVAGFKDMGRFAAGVDKLIKELKLSVALKDYGINSGDLEEILKRSFTAGNIANNLKRIDRKDLGLILKRML